MLQNITFQNSNNIDLAGSISEVDGGINRPVVVMLPGYPSIKDGRKFITFESHLNNLGFSTFRFDYLGLGESSGDVNELDLTEYIDDANCAMNYLSSIGYQKFTLIGNSAGGAASIQISQNNSKIDKLVLISPVIDFFDKQKNTYSKEELDNWKKNGYHEYIRSSGEPFKVPYRLFEDIQKYDGYKACEKIKCPTLLISGDLDTTVPIELARKGANLIPDCKLIVQEGNGHYYKEDERYFGEMIEEVVGFVAKN